MVVPDGLLTNSRDQYIREYLMGRRDPETGKFLGGKSVVKAVVSLPTSCRAGRPLDTVPPSRDNACGCIVGS